MIIDIFITTYGQGDVHHSPLGMVVAPDGYADPHAELDELWAKWRLLGQPDNTFIGWLVQEQGWFPFVPPEKHTFVV